MNSFVSESDLLDQDFRKLASADTINLCESYTETSGTYPTWNFHKYLIGRDGKLIDQFSPHTKPDDPKLVGAIDLALKQ